MHAAWQHAARDSQALAAVVGGARGTGPSLAPVITAMRRGAVAIPELHIRLGISEIPPVGVSVENVERQNPRVVLARAADFPTPVLVPGEMAADSLLVAHQSEYRLVSDVRVEPESVSAGRRVATWVATYIDSREREHDDRCPMKRPVQPICVLRLEEVDGSLGHPPDPAFPNERRSPRAEDCRVRIGAMGCLQAGVHPSCDLRCLALRADENNFEPRGAPIDAPRASRCAGWRHAWLRSSAAGGRRSSSSSSRVMLRTQRTTSSLSRSVLGSRVRDSSSTITVPSGTAMLWAVNHSWRRSSTRRFNSPFQSRRSGIGKSWVGPSWSAQVASAASTAGDAPPVD